MAHSDGVTDAARPAEFDFLSADKLHKLCLAFILLGIVWRVARYALQFPIWGDEAFVCLSLLDQDYRALAGPLKCGQVAPLLFLWGEMAVYQGLGNSELAVRLLPLLAGLGSLFLFHRLAWRTLPPLAATFAVGFLAVAYWPVSMSNTVKPYSFDLFMSLALLVPAAEWLRQPDRHRWLVALTLICPLAIFSSYPAVFVAGAVSVALLPTLCRQSSSVARLLYVAFNVLMCAAFLAHFGLVAVNQLGRESNRLESYLRNYWSDGFPPLDVGAFVQWVVTIHTGRLCAYPIGGSNGGSALSALLMIAGLVQLVRQRRGVGLILLILVPFALNFIAAVLQKYPYGGCCRLSQHLAPALCLLAGLGIASLVQRIARTVPCQRRWVGGIAVLLILVPLIGMGRDVCKPYKGIESLRARTQLRELFSQAQPDDQIVVMSPTEDVDPVYRWLLSQHGHRVQWNGRIHCPASGAPVHILGLHFHPAPSTDLEALRLGQFSISPPEVVSWSYQAGHLSRSAPNDLSCLPSIGSATRN